MMKKSLLTINILITLLATAQERPYDYNFFTNSQMPDNYFFTHTSFKAPSFIKNENGKLPVNDGLYHTPGNSLQLEYTNGKQGKWQVLLIKKEIRGQDHFKKASYLSFWVMNSSGLKSGMPLVGFMTNDSTFTRKRPISVGTQKDKWTQVKIPLALFGNPDPEKIRALVFSQGAQDGAMHNLYIDDVELLTENFSTAKLPVPEITEAKGYARHIDLSWKPVTGNEVKYVKIYRSADGKSFKPVGIQYPFTSRYADYTGETTASYQYKISLVGNDFSETGFSSIVTAQTKEMSDDELLDMVQQASFRYYWEGAETNSGLAKENIAGRHQMIATGASGFGILALIAGTERKFITRAQSVERFIRIVNFLEKADRFHGAYSHFIDGKTGRAEPFFGKRDNGGDLVETSFLVQGLLAARAYFNGSDPNEKKIRDKITAIWETIEWDWYRRFPDSKFLYWHWSPDKAWVINHRLIGWNETMVTYLLAITSPTHGVPASMYYSGWANQDSTGQQYRSNWGGTSDGSMYTNGKTYYGIKLDVGVSNGGPLFFTHYSYLGYDPHALTDKYTNYFINNQNIARINHSYCVENPGGYKGYGDSCWGLTASDGPYNYAADEPVLRQDKGKIGPTGAISSFPYTPKESMKALKNYYYNYGKFIWGEYGFRDAFNLTENWCSEIYMGLNQAPMTVMIENYRTGLIWKLFMSDADVQNGLKKLAAEKP